MGCIQLEWLTLPPCVLNEGQMKGAHRQFTAIIHPYILRRLNDGGYDVKRKDAKGWAALTLLTHHFMLDCDTPSCCIAESLLKSIDECFIGDLSEAQDAIVVGFGKNEDVWKAKCQIFTSPAVRFCRHRIE